MTGPWRVHRTDCGTGWYVGDAEGRPMGGWGTVFRRRSVAQAAADNYNAKHAAEAK